MKKLVAGLIAIALLLMAPGAGAGANEGTTPETATASAGFVRLPGPMRLEARRRLRVAVRCTVTCRVRTRTVLVLPGPDLGPLVSRTVLSPGDPRDLVLTLNGPATRTLKSNVGRARLKVRASATNVQTSGRAAAFRVFRFKR